MAEKKKVKAVKPGKIVSYDKLEPAVRSLFDETYADGYENLVARYPKPNGEYFYAVPLEAQNAHYLIKVDVKIDMTYDVDEDKTFFGGDDDEVADGVGDVSTSTDAEELADTLADDFNEPA